MADKDFYGELIEASHLVLGVENTYHYDEDKYNSLHKWLQRKREKLKDYCKSNGTVLEEKGFFFAYVLAIKIILEVDDTRYNDTDIKDGYKIFKDLLCDTFLKKNKTERLPPNSGSFFCLFLEKTRRWRKQSNMHSQSNRLKSNAKW